MNPSGNGFHHKTEDANVGASIVYLMRQWCRACGHCDVSGDAHGRRCICICRHICRRINRRRRSVSVKQEGFHVTGTRRGSLGASLVSEDWRVRVFWSSGLLDRLYDSLYVRNITLSGCIGRHPHYKITDITVTIIAIFRLIIHIKDNIFCYRLFSKATLLVGIKKNRRKNFL